MTIVSFPDLGTVQETKTALSFARLRNPPYDSKRWLEISHDQFSHEMAAVVIAESDRLIVLSLNIQSVQGILSSYRDYCVKNNLPIDWSDDPVVLQEFALAVAEFFKQRDALLCAPGEIQAEVTVTWQ